MMNFRLVGIYNLVTGITLDLHEQKMKRYDLVIFLATVKSVSISQKRSLMQCVCFSCYKFGVHEDFFLALIIYIITNSTKSC